MRTTEKLTFKLVRRGGPHSRYDWLNIDCEDARVGRVRCAIDDRTLTICSINIFPEFERHGYARATIEMFKKEFDMIIADRVRYTARGFWHKMGFVDQHDGSFVYGVSLTPEGMERGEVRCSPNTGRVSESMEAL